MSSIRAFGFLNSTIVSKIQMLTFQQNFYTLLAANRVDGFIKNDAAYFRPYIQSNVWGSAGSHTLAKKGIWILKTPDHQLS